MSKNGETRSDEASPDGVGRNRAERCEVCGDLRAELDSVYAHLNRVLEREKAATQKALSTRRPKAQRRRKARR